jgi:hypothetical protein
MKVVSFDISDWVKEDGTVKVTTIRFDDGQEVRGYDLPKEPRVGEPLPDGWEIATSKAGKPYIKVPKPGGGRGGGAPAAFRNTRDGFLLEQASIHRSVALQRAVEYYPDRVAETEANLTVLQIADDFYAWLSKTPVAPQQAPSTPQPVRSEAKKDEGSSAARTGGEWGAEPKEGEPDGSPLPKGFVRCNDCGTVMKG